MKNSTDEKSKKKKKGPIRSEAVIPALIASALLCAYYILFFDAHLKKAIELIGSYAYGAEIDIDDLSTSIKNAKIDIRDVQLTDVDQPERNFLQIGRMRLQMSWDALLRAKFVVTDAAIEEIRLHSPRDRAGKIYRSRETSQDQLEKAEKQVLQNTQETFSGNIFGDAASLLEGTDPAEQLKVVEDELQTKKKIDQIQNDLQTKEQLWKQRLESLPNKEKLDQMAAELKSLKFDSKNPQEIAEAVKKGSKILQEADQQLKTIEKESSGLKNDIDSLQSQIKDLDETRKKDIASLQNRIQIPELDTKTIATILFGDQVRDYERKFGRYIQMGREYLPAGNEAAPEKTGITPKERALGKTYEFPTTKSYPLFWLQKGSISSTADNSSLSGNLAGQIVDLTSNQKLVGKPTEVRLSGEFPNENVFGIDAKATSDHSGEQPVETLKASIDRYPAPRKNFSDSEKVKFGFNRAVGGIKIDGVLKGKQLDMNIDHTLRQIDYFVEAQSSAMKEVLQNVTQDVPVITVGARLSGDWRQPKLSLHTNLAAAIAGSLQRQLKAKIEEAKKKLEAKIDQAVGDARAKLMNEFNRAKGKYLGQVENIEKQAAAAKSRVQAEIDKAKNSQTKSIENKAKQELDKLRKKFKF